VTSPVSFSCALVTSDGLDEDLAELPRVGFAGPLVSGGTGPSSLDESPDPTPRVKYQIAAPTIPNPTRPNPTSSGVPRLNPEAAGGGETGVL